MNKTRSVKIIKEQERKVPEITQTDDSAADPDRWSTAVSSWVMEFKQQRHIELLPGFDSLFKDSLLSGKAEIGPRTGARKRVSTGRNRKPQAGSVVVKKEGWPQIT